MPGDTPNRPLASLFEAMLNDAAAQSDRSKLENDPCALADALGIVAYCCRGRWFVGIDAEKRAEDWADQHPSAITGRSAPIFIACPDRGFYRIGW